MNSLINDHFIKGIGFSVVSVITGGATLLDKIAEWNTILAFVGGGLAIVSSLLGAYYVCLGIKLRHRQIREGRHEEE